MFGIRRQAAVWAAVAALGFVIVGQAAFAEVNTVPASSAGQGSAVVSGFTITNIDYNMNAADPTKIDTVTFDAQSGDATYVGNATVKVKFDVSAGDWYACSTAGVAVAGLFAAISCDTDAAPGPQLTAANIDTFNVVIVQQ